MNSLSAGSDCRRGQSEMRPSDHLTLVEGPSPARADASPELVARASKSHEHVRHDCHKSRSIVARQMRAIFAHFPSYGGDVARFHPSTQKHRGWGREQIAGEPNYLFNHVPQRKRLSSGSPAVAVRCEIPNRREPGQGLVLEVPCAPQVADGMFNASLPVCPTTTQTCGCPAPRRGRVSKAKSAGCDRFRAYRPIWTEGSPGCQARIPFFLQWFTRSPRLSRLMTQRAAEVEARLLGEAVFTAQSVGKGDLLTSTDQTPSRRVRHQAVRF